MLWTNTALFHFPRQRQVYCSFFNREIRCINVKQSCAKIGKFRNYGSLSNVCSIRLDKTQRSGFTDISIVNSDVHSSPVNKALKYTHRKFANPSLLYGAASVAEEAWKKQREKKEKRAAHNERRRERFSAETPWKALPKHGDIARAGDSKVTVVSHSFPEEVGHILGKTDSQVPSAENLFAVVTVAGTQFKVSPGDRIYVNKIEGNAGDIHTFEHVLLIGTGTKSYIGRPVIPDAIVTALIEEQTKDAKMIVLKRRRKNNSSRTMRGHRRRVSFLRITDISYSHLEL